MFLSLPGDSTRLQVQRYTFPVTSARKPRENRKTSRNRQNHKSTNRQ